ncbi:MULTISPECIES: hypothetical protein [Bizionia]|uniref:Lipocalin-like domain-containing protein n=1 Tax=Bizionia algoritergicola TaxID=291187 RepID=A0A5D0QSS8_9FLAO|nr:MULTISPECIES: hypothetical protein [Bizionia]OBX21114.1 hypothetical protein BAA08_14105 [Bizionia sp. APA-3]TYB72240.1 hypothetical protein ES675_10750 [Bizionia algoritergicola]
MKQYLKSFTLLSLSIFFITFTACDNEPLDRGLNTLNSSNNTNSSSFIGDWEIVSFETETDTEITFMGETNTSNNDIVGLDMNYIVSFTENTFETAGDYSMHLITSFNGSVLQEQTETYSNVSGSGTYTVSGNTLTTDGAFFEFEFQDVDMSDYAGEQTVQYAFSNGGQTLTIIQTQEISEDQGGIESTTLVYSVTIMNKL